MTALLTKKIPTEYLWRMTIDRYHEMIAAGLFTEDDPVELINGWITRKMPKSPLHTMVTHLLLTRLQQLLTDGYFVHTESPITFNDSEPEPDIAVITGRPQDYRANHPKAADIPLIIEVADSSLRKDRHLKQLLYSTASIPTYWIINLQDNQIEQFTAPTPNGYQTTQIFTTDDPIPLSINNQPLGHITLINLIS